MTGISGPKSLEKKVGKDDGMQLGWIATVGTRFSKSFNTLKKRIPGRRTPVWTSCEFAVEHERTLKLFQKIVLTLKLITCSGS